MRHRCFVIILILIVILIFTGCGGGGGGDPRNDPGDNNYTIESAIDWTPYQNHTETNTLDLSGLYDYNYYKFIGYEGVTYTITLTGFSDDLNLYLSYYDEPVMVSVEGSQNSGLNPETIEFVCDESRLYYISVSGQNNSTETSTNYTLSLSSSGSAVPSIVLNGNWSYEGQYTNGCGLTETGTLAVNVSGSAYTGTITTSNALEPSCYYSGQYSSTANYTSTTSYFNVTQLLAFMNNFPDYEFSSATILTDNSFELVGSYNGYPLVVSFTQATGTSQDLDEINIVGNWDYEISVSGCDKTHEGTLDWVYSNGEYDLSIYTIDAVDFNTCQYTGISGDCDDFDFPAGNPISKTDFLAGMNNFSCVASHIIFTDVSFDSTDHITLNGTIGSDSMTWIITK